MRYNKKPMIGKKFSKLTVIEEEGRHGDGSIKYRCKCECGKEIVIVGIKLRNGKTRNCGCSRRIYTKRPYESLYNTRFVHIAKRKGKEFLSYEEFAEFAKTDICHYCGAKVKWAKYAPDKNGTAYNIDRKDSSIGYIKENCVVCCTRCNRGKMHLFSYKEWYKMTEVFRNGTLRS